MLDRSKVARSLEVISKRLADEVQKQTGHLAATAAQARAR